MRPLHGLQYSSKCGLILRAEPNNSIQFSSGDQSTVAICKGWKRATRVCMQDTQLTTLPKCIDSKVLLAKWQLFIVSTVRQFWKLGTAVREPGARTRRVRAPRPWCGSVVISQP